MEFLQLPVLLLHDRPNGGSNKDRGPDRGLGESEAMTKYQNHRTIDEH